MKKNLLSIALLITVFSYCMPINTNVSAMTNSFKSIKENLNNGDYIVTILESNNNTRTNTKSGSKTIYYYDNKDELLWSFTLNGEFSYTGKNSTCINTSCYSTMVSNSWKENSSSSKANKNKAIGTITAKSPYQTINREVTIVCSNSGELS